MKDVKMIKLKSGNLWLFKKVVERCCELCCCCEWWCFGFWWYGVGWSGWFGLLSDLVLCVDFLGIEFCFNRSVLCVMIWWCFVWCWLLWRWGLFCEVLIVWVLCWLLLVCGLLVLRFVLDLSCLFVMFVVFMLYRIVRCCVDVLRNWIVFWVFLIMRCFFFFGVLLDICVLLLCLRLLLFVWLVGCWCLWFGMLMWCFWLLRGWGLKLSDWFWLVRWIWWFICVFIWDLDLWVGFLVVVVGMYWCLGDMLRWVCWCWYLWIWWNCLFLGWIDWVSLVLYL